MNSISSPPTLVDREQEYLGVDQFNIYLMHDAMEETLRAYGEEVMSGVEAKSIG